MRIKILILTSLFLFFGVSSAFANSVVLNEFMSHPSSGGDWIEIYNPTSSSIDLSNWVLDDSTSTMKALSGNIPANGFVSFDVSNRLNNGGDSIYLKDSSGNTIDNYSYSSDPGTDKSIGRNPDGGNWSTLTTSSKGNSNGAVSSTPSPTPSPIPQPTTNPASSPTSSPNSSSFTITNVSSKINSDQSFSVTVNLSLPSNPSSAFYLKGAFKKADGSNYFGQTKVSGNWIKNGSSSSSQFPITTDSSGNWSDNLEVKPDSSDSGFTGSGEYTFKVGRYTSSGSGPSWSNELSLNIEASTEIADQSLEKNDNSSSSTYGDEIPASSIVSKPVTSKISNIKYKVATVAGASFSASPSAAPQDIEIKNQKQINPLLVVGILLVFAGLASLGYIYFKRK